MREDERVPGQAAAWPSSASSTRRVPLPAHPAGVPWPTQEWPTGHADDDVDAEALRRATTGVMTHADALGVTHALVVVHRGRIVTEAYGMEADAGTPLISWSTAKSMTHALVGMAVGDGLLDVDAPAPVEEWADDDRRAITLQHLLDMRDGLDFNEEYVDVGGSHVVDMLFVEGKDDVAGYTARRPLAHEPGTVWNYSSGTTNVVSRIVGRAVAAAGTPMPAYLQTRLFDPLGMSSAVATFDAAGTFIGSSFVHATARDFARFGYLYLRDGVWDGRRLLPEGWVDHARTWSADDVPADGSPDTGFSYGAHWWIWRDQPGSLAAHGYEGQYVVVLPERDLVVVRLGKTDAALRPALVAEMRELIGAFPVAEVEG